ncbi:MAG: hypothetical protein LBF75_01495 [Treponema sp.]|jgi:hypothetical protein|nr:hypothetical protein [Treponema sp.]
MDAEGFWEEQALFIGNPWIRRRRNKTNSAHGRDRVQESALRMSYIAPLFPGIVGSE